MYPGIMATAAPQADERELECSVCTELQTDARLLPCSHTMCQTCLVRIQRGDQPACPLCRHPLDPRTSSSPSFSIFTFSPQQHCRQESTSWSALSVQSCRQTGVSCPVGTLCVTDASEGFRADLILFARFVEQRWTLV